MMEELKTQIQRIWNNKSFQKAMDIIRILLLIIAVIILIVLIINIQEVKLLSGDPCALCMSKTNATCISQNIFPN